jgi:endonuclease-3
VDEFACRQARAGQIDRRLLEAYGQPDWRPTHPALDELILTILSQNTSDLNSGRAFAALRARYPTWQAVLEAPVEELAETIRSGGLAEQKAPRLQAALRRIRAERGELSLDFLAQWPPAQVLSYLTSYPGVGPKTAAIVALFSFGMPAFPVDTHVTRVTRRLGLAGPRATPEQVQAIWEALVSPDRFFPLHLNLIRHGREVCKAPTPRCWQCVLHDLCDYPDKVTVPPGPRRTASAA